MVLCEEKTVIERHHMETFSALPWLSMLHKEKASTRRLCGKRIRVVMCRVDLLRCIYKKTTSGDQTMH